MTESPSHPETRPEGMCKARLAITYAIAGTDGARSGPVMYYCSLPKGHTGSHEDVKLETSWRTERPPVLVNASFPLSGRRWVR